MQDTRDDPVPVSAWNRQLDWTFPEAIKLMQAGRGSVTQDSTGTSVKERGAEEKSPGTRRSRERKAATTDSLDQVSINPSLQLLFVDPKRGDLRARNGAILCLGQGGKRTWDLHHALKVCRARHRSEDDEAAEVTNGCDRSRRVRFPVRTVPHQAAGVTNGCDRSRRVPLEPGGGWGDGVADGAAEEPGQLGLVT